MRVKNAFVSTLLILALFLGTLVLTLPASMAQAGTFCDHTGRNSLGALRALHVDPTTHLIVDSQGCQVMLRGVNTMLGTGSGGSTQMLTEINTLASSAQVDVMRMNFQAVWYDQDLYVPNVGMYYRDWVAKIIANNDAAGVYTMLDKGEQYTEPPCVGNGDFCGDQTTGSQEAQGTPEAGDPDGTSDPNAWQEASDGSYMTPALDDWAAIASTFAGDNGVLYDTWNEAHKLINTNPAQWEANQEQMINMIRGYAPNSLIFYFAPPDNNHGFTYSQYSNLVEDFHEYGSGSPLDFNCTKFQSNISAAYAAGHAISIGEWGNPNGAQTEPYNTDINSCATSAHIGLIYYTMAYLFNGSGSALNANGSAYASDNATDYANY